MLDTGNEATEGTILDGRSHIRTELRRQSYALPLKQASPNGPHLILSSLYLTKLLKNNTEGILTYQS